MGRETTTGRVLEEMILPALRRAGYTWTEQTCIGCRPGGRKHKVDLVVSREGQDRALLVSMKWQEASGTAEQKVPFEAMCLADALKEGSYGKAYLVLGGPGWTLRDWYVSGALQKRLVGADDVQVATLEAFVAKANQGKL
ncbi:hypothetical protein LuPra_06120 [Luteitalea pratensis]|uniref:PD-(D/E)XK nuclease domain-containing protein n=1 Tax=Luteitalea pratensis TaxID=1855912 RepID=A0A143PX63_LUTPR|nr:hypothetical protein LuPra_06120 [Luteitalea pratensis]